MSNVFSPEDSKRLKKLEEALMCLRKGEITHFPITKLVSIKSLCKNSDTLNKYCVYLSEQVLKKPGKLPIKYTKKDVKLIIENAVSSPKKVNQARELLNATIDLQNVNKKVGFSTVRIIKHKEMLILECVLRALLSSSTNVSQKYVYDATKNYVEAYNGVYGTGLIVDSIPMFEKVIKFWKLFEQENSKYFKERIIKNDIKEDITESLWRKKGETLSHKNACK